MGLPPRLPRILKIVVDCSGSMYRFNSTDMRLQRTMDAIVMLLESLHGREQVQHRAFLFESFIHLRFIPCAVCVELKRPLRRLSRHSSGAVQQIS